MCENLYAQTLMLWSQALHEDVRKKALMRLEYEGLSKCEAVSTEGARWYNDPAGFAMERYAYYVCFKCGKAYFGGEARRDLDAGAGDAFNPEELVCGGCSDVSQAQMCPKHGTDYLEYKVLKSSMKMFYQVFISPSADTAAAWQSSSALEQHISAM